MKIGEFDPDVTEFANIKATKNIMISEPTVFGATENDATNPKLLNILYTNADSLANKLDELQTVINEGQPDVIAVTEALPKRSYFKVQEEDLALDGYNSISNFSDAQKHNGRGIILYVVADITCVKRDVVVEFHEHLMVDIVLATGSEVSIGVFYRSPSSKYENNIKLLQCVTNFASSKDSKIILLGDFNLPKIKWTTLSAPSGSYEEDFVECILENFLFQLIYENTRMRCGNEGNILDLVFTKEEGYVSAVEYGSHLGKSDHLVLQIILDELTVSCNVLTKKRFQYYKGNYEGMREKLSDIQWDELFVGKSIEACWELFKNILLDLQDEFVPLATMEHNQRPQWMDRSVALALKEKKSSWKKYYFCRSPENFERYKAKRNKLKSVIQDARRNLELKIADEVKEKPKAFWRYVSRKTKETNQLHQVRNSHGQLTQSNEETAICLNDFQMNLMKIHLRIRIQGKTMQQILNLMKICYSNF